MGLLPAPGLTGRRHGLPDLHDEVGLRVGGRGGPYHSHVGCKVYSLGPEGLQLPVQLVPLLLYVLLVLLKGRLHNNIIN